MPPPPPFPILAMAPDLELSEQQVEAIHTLLKSRRGALEASHRAAREAEEKVRRAMADPGTDAGALESLHQKAAQARGEALKAAHVVVQEAAKLLTPAQRQRYVQLLSEHRPMRPEGPGRGMGRPGGRSAGPSMGGPGMGGPMGRPGTEGPGREGDCEGPQQGPRHQPPPPPDGGDF